MTRFVVEGSHILHAVLQLQTLHIPHMHVSWCVYSQLHGNQKVLIRQMLTVLGSTLSNIHNFAQDVYFNIHHFPSSMRTSWNVEPVTTLEIMNWTAI